MKKGWTTVALGDLMPKRGSIDPRRSPDEEFSLLSIPAFDSGAPERVLGCEVGSTKQVVEPGDVLLSKIVPHIRRAWIVPQGTRPCIGSSEWIVFCEPHAHPGYLRHLLISDRFHQSFMQTVAGVGGSLLRARPAHVAKIQVPLPPLEEQRRIAAILDKADDLLAKRRAALAHLDTLTQAIFIDMFGDPVANPRGWVVHDLGDVLSDLQYGPRFYDDSYSDHGVPIVRITDVDDAGELNYPAMPRMNLPADKVRKHRLRAGDILFARSGSVGKVAVIAAGDPECIAGAYFVVLRTSIEVDPMYLRGFLRSEPLRLLIAARSRQAAQPNFSGPAIRRLRVPVPPAELQRQFTSVIRRLRSMGGQFNSGLEEAMSLARGLQARAFRGEL